MVNIRNTEDIAVARALRALAIMLKNNGTITQEQFDNLKQIAGDNS